MVFEGSDFAFGEVWVDSSFPNSVIPTQERQDMIQIRKSKERGYFDHGWLKSFHTFSFSEYYDPEWMGFNHLRVINEDWIEGGEGFPTHPHRDMEIITYPIEGALAHRDSTGGNGVIKPGEIQTMTAGAGIRHSEFNGLKDQTTHLYQIWIMPNEKGLKPAYDQKDFLKEIESGEPVLLVSPDAANGSLPIHQDARLWVRRVKIGVEWKLPIAKGRAGWIQIVKGEFQLGQHSLKAGDAAGIENENQLVLKSNSDAEVLVFEF